VVSSAAQHRAFGRGRECSADARARASRPTGAESRASAPRRRAAERRADRDRAREDRLLADVFALLACCQLLERVAGVAGGVNKGGLVWR
jgi:hypothetical protein